MTNATVQHRPIERIIVWADGTVTPFQQGMVSGSWVYDSDIFAEMGIAPEGRFVDADWFWTEGR